MKIKKREKNEISPSLQKKESFPLRDVMSRLFEESFWSPSDFFSDVSLDDSINSFYPKTDITENEKEIKVLIDIPGVDPEKIEIEAEENSLSLSGKTEKEEEEKNKRYYKYERSSGKFKRYFSLPSKIDPDRVFAKVKNGVLTITLPKINKENKKKVKVSK